MLLLRLDEPVPEIGCSTTELILQERLRVLGTGLVVAIKRRTRIVFVQKRLLTPRQNEQREQRQRSNAKSASVGRVC